MNKTLTHAIVLGSLALAAAHADFRPPPGSGIQDPVPLGGEDCDHGDGPLLAVRPSAHLRAIYGMTDLGDAGLAGGGHDPKEDGLNIQGISVGADFHLGENLFGFTEAIFSWDRHTGWDGELEELFVKWLDIPGGFTLKGGRFLATVGWNNTAHNHEWQFVDSHLGLVRFLGDDGLVLEGVEIGWAPPTRWDDALTIGFGNTVEHSHEEAGHDDDDDHGHHGEAEEALWNQDVLTLRYEARFWPTDHCGFIYGVNYIRGKNFMGRRARLYGADVTYIWLRDDEHGEKLTWTNEIMLRKVDTGEGGFGELAFSSRAVWRFAPSWEAGLRYDYLESASDPELPERHRISPGLTRHFKLSNNVKAIARLQYNYDHSDGRGGDHSVWLMFGFDWGQGDDHVH